MAAVYSAVLPSDSSLITFDISQFIGNGEANSIGLTFAFSRRANFKEFC